jgi:metal-dependent amidase/aminoacylase/carboxypeptidase family protein
MTEGGDSVNIIPAKTRLETYVRGISLACIHDVNEKVNRALAASAATLGAKVSIQDRHGYAPLKNDQNLLAVAIDSAKAWAGEERVMYESRWGTGCTDMGDLSCVMPAVHPHVSGASGTAHGIDFVISDVEKACVNSAIVQLMTVDSLLQKDAKKAKMILKEAKPDYPSIRAYLNKIEKIAHDLDAVTYREDGKIEIQYR